MHQVHSLLANHPTQMRTGARAWPCRSLALRPCRRPGGRVAAQGLPCRGCPTPCRSSQDAVSWVQCRTHQRRVVAWPPGRVATQLPTQPPLVTIHETVLQYSFSINPKSFSWPQYTMCIAIQKKKTQQPASAGHNTLLCIVIKTPATQAFSHITLIVLQYNSNSLAHL